MGAAKDVDKKARTAFKTVRQEIHDLKKARKNLSVQVNDLNLRLINQKKTAASEEELKTMRRDVNSIAHDHQEIKNLHGDVSSLQKSAADKSNVEKVTKSLEKDVKNLRKDIDTVRKNKRFATEARVALLEKNTPEIDDIREVVLADVKRNYLDAKEVGIEMNGLRKEFHDLQERVSKIRKDVIGFPRWSMFANIIVVLALIALLGALVALYLDFSEAANFLGIEGGLLLIVGLLVKAGMALAK